MIWSFNLTNYYENLLENKHFLNYRFPQPISGNSQQMCLGKKTKDLIYVKIYPDDFDDQLSGLGTSNVTKDKYIQKCNNLKYAQLPFANVLLYYNFTY